MKAVVVGPRDDAHVDAVCAWLQSRSWQVSWLELELSPDNYTLSGPVHDPTIETALGVFNRTTMRDAHVFMLRLAVDEPDFVKPVGTDSAFAAREWNAFFHATMEVWERSGQRRWLIGSEASRLQNRKGLLLNLAHKHGARVPDSEMVGVGTAVPRSAPVVAKALNAWQQIARGRYFNTTLISATDLQELDDVRRIGPLLLQSYIQHSRERRLYVVGKFAFAVERTARHEAIDFRTLDADAADARVVEASASSHKFATMLMNELGLRYCVFDILVDSQDREWLVDVNPLGSWHYLEKIFNLGITSLIMTGATSE